LRPERAVNIVGLTLKELEEEFVHFGLPKYRATQVFQWLYGQGSTSFDEMPTLGKKLISQLKEHYYVDAGSATVDTTSEDGTRKWLVDLGNKQCVESTYSREPLICSSFSALTRCVCIFITYITNQNI
jgi:23S rRNA (adenine2503-C2)-methyltransferase